MSDEPARMLTDRLIELWERGGCPPTRAIANRSKQSGGAPLPNSTIHDWLRKRRTPRHWEQLHAFLMYFEEQDLEEWKRLWSKATSVVPESVVPESVVPRLWRPRHVVGVAVLGVVTAGIVVALMSVGDPSRSANCHEAVEYRVDEVGNVVDENGRGVAQVLPGDRFLHDPTTATRTASKSRLHGRVIGRDIAGFVRTHKLEFERTIQVCP